MYLFPLMSSKFMLKCNIDSQAGTWVYNTVHSALQSTHCVSSVNTEDKLKCQQQHYMNSCVDTWYCVCVYWKSIMFYSVSVRIAYCIWTPTDTVIAAILLLYFLKLFYTMGEPILLQLTGTLIWMLFYIHGGTVWKIYAVVNVFKNGWP